MAISPGVYSKIIPLESYVQEVPASTGFIVAITPKGPDNKLTFIGSLKELDETFGKPNLVKYGKYSHGHYIARNFATINPALYMIRVLPTDASYSNLTTYVFYERPDYIDANGVQRYSSNPVRFYVESIPNISSLDAVLNPSGEPKTYIKIEGGDIVELSATATPDGTVQLTMTPALGVSEDLAKEFISVYDTGTNAYVVVDTQAGVVDNTKQPITKDIYFKVNESLYRLVFDSTTNVFDVQAVVDLTTFNPQFESHEVLYSFVGKGRGEWYNNLALGYDIFENRTDYIIFNTYEKIDETNIVQTSSFNVSFNPDAVDDAYNSIYIKEVFDRYSKDIAINIDEENYVSTTNKATQLVKTFLLDRESSSNAINRVDEVIINIVDLIVHSDDELLQYDSGTAFVVNKAGGSINQYQGQILAFEADGNIINSKTIQYGEIIGVRKGNDIELYIHANDGILYKYDPYLHSVFTNDLLLDKQFLENGSDGSLINQYGAVDPVVANQLIASAYIGGLDKDVINTETIWFDLVLDAGYPREVKNQIVKLTNDIRRDCIAILDNGDNVDADSAVNRRNTEHYYNSEYAAIYEPYIKVYDTISGKNIWISPVYSVSKLIAINDKINEVWYAVAGFRRGTDSEILETRYSPTLSERDQFYLNQINPIVTFKEGKVLWGQLTTRRITDPLQDLNIMRLILYVKRAIEQFSKYELFEFNDIVTWQRIENAIKTFLQDVKDRRGLYDFKVSVYATEYQKQRKAATVDILLYPTRALERIYLNFFIK